MDYGHWTVFKDVDIKNYIGFVYVISFENGKKYIGAKKIWKRIKAAPCTFKRGPRAGFEESDWKYYTSSSKEVNSMLNEDVAVKSMNIVGWYSTWGKTLMAEMEMQLANDVLRSDEWLNKQIGGHFNPACYDDLTSDDVKTWMSFDKGNEHVNWPVMYKIGEKTKYVDPSKVTEFLNNGWALGRARTEKCNTITTVVSYTLWDEHEQTLVHVKNQSAFAKQYDVEPGHLSRLLKGEMDCVSGRWSLPGDIARNKFRYKDCETGQLFETQAEAELFYNVKRGGLTKLIKLKTIEKLIPETRAAYIKRLGASNIVTIERDVSTHQLMQNSFKDLLNPLSDEAQHELIDWAKKYLEYFKL